MRKALLMCASLLAALAIIGPASASAQSPDIAVCLGVGTNDGSFEAQRLDTGSLPGVGLGLAPETCLAFSPDAGSRWLSDFTNGLAEAEPPTEPPTQEEIQAIIDAIAGINPDNPLAVLGAVDAICQNGGIGDYCNALIGGALSSPLPLGGVSLDGQQSQCFNGTQSGTGSMFGGGTFYQLEWEADYSQTNNQFGQISGTATPFFGGSGERELTGLIGPGCGAGTKVLVLVAQ